MEDGGIERSVEKHHSCSQLMRYWVPMASSYHDFVAWWLVIQLTSDAGRGGRNIPTYALFTCDMMRYHLHNKYMHWTMQMSTLYVL